MAEPLADSDAAAETATDHDHQPQQKQQQQEESEAADGGSSSGGEQGGGRRGTKRARQQSPVRGDGADGDASGDGVAAGGGAGPQEDTYRVWTIAGEEVAVKVPTKKRLRKLTEQQRRLLAYKHRLGELCREDNMLQALRAYEEMKALNMQMDTAAFRVLLAVCGGNAGDKDELNTGNGDVESSRREREELKANGPPPGSAELHPELAAQASYKIYTEDMPAAGIRRIPESAFTALIRAACRAGKVARGLALLETLLATRGEKPRIRSYGPLLAACAEEGRLDDCMDLWKGALQQGLRLTEREYLSLVTVCTRARSAERFEEVVSNYMEDVLQPRSRQSWDVVRAWFAGEGGWEITECDVAADGTCGCCARVLESIELSEDMTARLLSQVSELVCTNDKRRAQWATFTKWVEASGLGFNVIVDGANVGYFKKQGATQGETLADLEQIDWVVRHYEAQGKRVLVVLHSRHLQERKLTPERLAVLQRWKEQGLVQSCMPHNNDDWYWLWMAVRLGGRVLVVTNDEMRDHHFQMLSHRSFQRWKERHQVRFAFGEWIGNRRPVLAREPRRYSKRIQRSPAGDSWHFPVEGEERWLCVRRPGAASTG